MAVGDETTPQEIATDLRHAGYTESANNRMGHYALKPDEIDIYPGPESYFKREDGVIKFEGGKVSRIISLADNTDRTEYTLEPELISNLFDKNREKRRLVKYEDIPPVLVHAVVSVEDKRFFQHSGFDPIRIVQGRLRRRAGAPLRPGRIHAQPAAGARHSGWTTTRPGAARFPSC